MNIFCDRGVYMGVTLLLASVEKGINIRKNVKNMESSSKIHFFRLRETVNINRLFTITKRLCAYPGG